MPRPRFHRLTAEQREHILDVATTAFAEHGYERTSYNELLTQLGMTKGSAYHAFDGKADVYALVVDRAVARLAQALPLPASDNSTADSFWPGVVCWLDASFAYLSAHPDTARLLADAERSDINVDTSPLAAPILLLLRHGQRVGCVRVDLDDALLVGLTAAVLRALDRAALSTLSATTTTTTTTTTALSTIILETLQRLLRP
jgi:AcrR family transcriptional regulator